MNKIYAKIDGIHCSHCISKIKTALLKNKNIKIVDINNNIAHISYVNDIENNDIIKIITDLGYITKKEYISNNLKEVNNHIELKEFIIILMSIILTILLINKIFGFNIFNLIPTIDNSITYSMLICTGFLTSIHCISMCGAVNLTSIINSNYNIKLKRPFLYNLGRILSYTLIGGLIGFLGNVININNNITGVIIILASLMMLLISLNMLGIIDFKTLKLIHIKNKSHNAFLIGILNGFMPCGPLQALEIYALGTGSFIKGAISMFLFGIGTFPLMFIFGASITLFKGKIRLLVNKIASVLILILSISMLNRGLLSLNIDLSHLFNKYNSYTYSTLIDDYQTIDIDLTYDNYEDIIILKNVPVKMIIHVDKKYLTGCNNKIIINAFQIEKELKIGDNIIEFIPTRTGDYTYTCWMNMIKNNIKVIDNKKYFEGD